MAEAYVLAIDQGTTGTTVLVLDRAGDVRGRAYSEFTQHYPRPGWVEHDPEEIWRVALEVARRALDAADAGPGEIAAVGLTNQRETTVLWDRATGAPAAPAIVWQDRRTAPLTERLRAEGHGETVRATTGLVLDPYFSATKLRWLLDSDDALRARAERGELAFGTVDSWLLWKLSGGRLHATDVTNASRTLLYDIHQLRWDPALLALFGTPEALLPDVLPSAHVYCETAPEVFLGITAPVAGVAGDQHAALFGQACFEEGMTKGTYGTGSFILMQTGTTPVPSAHGLLTTPAWKLGDEPVEYALEGSIFVTGAAVQWLRDGLGIIGEAAETEALARSVADNGGVMFVPALSGLGAPHWDPYARGTILGLTRGATRAHLARATLESIAHQTADVLELMEREAGKRVPELRADGGAVANGFLMEFQADLLGVPVEAPQIPETTAAGAAYLAGLATGFWAGRDEVAGLRRAGARYVPRMAPPERDVLRRRWAEAVERARGWAREEGGG